MDLERRRLVISAAGLASFCRETGKRLLRNELTPSIGDRAHVSLQ